MNFMHIDDKLSDYDKIRRFLKVEREVPVFEKVSRLVSFLQNFVISKMDGDYECKACESTWTNKEWHCDHCIMKEL